MTPNPLWRSFAPGDGPRLRPAPHTDAGLVAGTPVWTADGEIAVEFLNPGDRIVTRNAGMVRLVGLTRWDAELHAVLVRAGALGRTRPQADLILPARQRVLVRDRQAQALFGAAQAVVPVGALADGDGVRDLGMRRMYLHQLHFDRPRLVYASGLEVAGLVPEPQRLRPAA